jgi:hypothetical protein
MNSHNNIFQQDNHFIIRKQEKNYVNSSQQNVKSGSLNPIDRNIIKKVINVNTRFRKNYHTTSSSDFIIDLPPLKNIISLKILEIKSPATIYSVSSKLGSNSFIVDNSLVDISDGAYLPDDIVIEIQNKMNILNLNKSIEYNENNGLITISDLSNLDFSLNFSYNFNTNLNCALHNSFVNNYNNIHEEHLTLGWLLGFRDNLNIKNKNDPYSMKQNIYTGKSKYVASAIYDDLASHYVLISLNDYQNNHDNVFISPFLNQSTIDTNILGKTHPYGSTTDRFKEDIVNPKRIYYGPTNIQKLHIKIFDEFGRIVDTNNSDYSLTLEIEQIYDL